MAAIVLGGTGLFNNSLSFSSAVFRQKGERSHQLFIDGSVPLKGANIPGALFPEVKYPCVSPRHSVSVLVGVESNRTSEIGEFPGAAHDVSS